MNREIRMETPVIVDIYTTEGKHKDTRTYRYQSALMECIDWALNNDLIAIVGYHHLKIQHDKLTRTPVNSNS